MNEKYAIVFGVEPSKGRAKGFSLFAVIAGEISLIGPNGDGSFASLDLTKWKNAVGLLEGMIEASLAQVLSNTACLYALAACLKAP